MSAEHKDTAPVVPDYDEKKLQVLIAAVDRAYSRPWLMMFRGFMQGFMMALGATVGTAVFFAASLWVFQSLGGIDLLKPGVEKLQNLIIPQELRDKATQTSQATDQLNSLLQQASATQNKSR